MFFEMLKMDRHQVKTVRKMLQFIFSKKLTVVFQNVCISFRIYLSVFAASCEGESSFSTIKRVKN